jgi:hypothetical protein
VTPALAEEDADYLENDPLSESGIDDQNESIESLDLDESLNLDESLDLNSSIDLAEPFDSEDLSISMTDESLDLSEAVIDEPDLSSEIQDNPLEEPSLEDLSINLDISDLDSEETEEHPEEISYGETTTDELNILEPEHDVEPAGDLSLLEDDLEVLEAEDDTGILTEEIGTLAEEVEAEESITEKTPSETKDDPEIPFQLKQELKTVLSYMDKLLEALPEEKIKEFAHSKYYNTYKKLFKELGLV